ncbi:hypothetical protein EVAR_47037_1 [Eumeta japonica]|uniref:Uncharacterized protein n=1 Tax=Eumeta variegata TaxID=151549 RepID=A0A4C1XHM9_EUMVA|nr:hypothetical protein EVAR_47037_1 [Eumeta japonica]
MYTANLPPPTTERQNGACCKSDPTYEEKHAMTDKQIDGHENKPTRVHFFIGATVSVSYLFENTTDVGSFHNSFGRTCHPPELSRAEHAAPSPPIAPTAPSHSCPV